MRRNIFTKRPILAFSISAVILVIGLISLFTLPVEQYPDIAPPTVMVATAYTGADANAVMKSVIMPLEESINGVENMLYMTSTAANNGSATITIYFKQGTNPDMAAVNVQNRVSKAQGLLPTEVTQVGVSVQKQQSSFLQIGGLKCTNGKYDEAYIANYLDINIFPLIKRIDGVSEVQAFSDFYSLRIWLKPEVMAQYGLIPSDITRVLGEQNIVAPVGSLGENSKNAFQYTLKYKGRLREVDEFKNMVIRSDASGNILRLKDVARVELGSQSYNFKGTIDGAPGVNFMINPVAGVNTTVVNDQLKALFEKAQKDLPDGLEFVSFLNSNDFLFASIHEVVVTLIIAIILVILVVYFFLHDIKSTIIPSISIIVSLVGTFAVLKAFGFSMNILTLFAMVLAIGTVVDDAIIVVEAVQSKFDNGYRSAYLATQDALRDVTMAVITTTLVFMAVFVPVSFSGGTAGIFYTQFGVTMATAVALSCVSALTLTPALCALIMRPARAQHGAKSVNGRVRMAYETTFITLQKKYKRAVTFSIRRPKLIWASLGVAVLLFAYFLNSTPTGLVPQEDKGLIIISARTSPGSSLNETSKVIDKIESVVGKQSEVKSLARVDGYGMMSGAGSSYATFFAKLKSWDERKGDQHSIDAVLGRINTQFANIKDAEIFAFQDGMIPGYGNGNAIELNLQDKTGGDMNTFYQASMNFMTELNKRPEILMAYSSYTMDFPQYSVDVDAAKCKRAGISPSAVLEVLGNYNGGTYASNFNQFGKVYRVMMQAEPQSRTDEHSLDNMYVRNGSVMAPLSQFVILRKVNGPEIYTRFNLFSSIAASISVKPGYSNGEAMKAIQEVADQYLPKGYSYEYGGISREEAKSGGSSTLIIYALSLIFIFFILSSLYESFLVPFAVILSVPFGLMGSFLFAKLFGLENNIYLQTAVIMLIGLLSKTAILITEYAVERRRKGMSIAEAAYTAAQVRFRPIMMTVLAMVFGMIPLVLATGAGARGSSSLGLGVIGGMLVGTIALLLIVPVLFIVFQFMQEKYVRNPMHKLADIQVEHEHEKYMESHSMFNPNHEE